MNILILISVIADVLHKCALKTTTTTVKHAHVTVLNRKVLVIHQTLME